MERERHGKGKKKKKGEWIGKVTIEEGEKDNRSRRGLYGRDANGLGSENESKRVGNGRGERGRGWER